MIPKKKYVYEMPHYTEHDLKLMDKEFIVWAYCLLQDKFEHLRDCDYVDLEERLRIMTARMFGRSSEKTDILTGSGRKKEKSAQDMPDDRNSDADGGDNKPGRENNGGGESKSHPVRKKGCSDKVTKDLPVIDEQIELSAEELKAVFGPGVKYVDDPNFEKTYDEVCTIPCTHYIVRYHIHVYRGNGKIVQAARVSKMKKGRDRKSVV